MGFGNLGFGEILIIAVVVLLLFGARRIPEVLGSMGKGINEFKRGLRDVPSPAAELPPRKRDDREPVTTQGRGEPLRLG
ncbi:MAG TPA: twin-arginine translocase TatA/TatE family subunit [Gemmatimonadaceae bacterium]|nr:twin-arginine translocase TatA/TatE family subunit [Gemmatimonadaceae bacterium]